MGHILLVDDGLDEQKIVSATLGSTHSLKIAGTLAEAERIIKEGDTDLILLDVHLPDGDGFKYCAVLQSDEATRPISILFLTARSEVPDKIMGFSLGAEDYISKPFDPRELRARVEGRLRKNQERKTRDVVLKLGDLKISLATQKAVLVKGDRETTLDLTPLEFKLLFHFARHQDHVFSRDQLLEAVWSDSVNVLDRTVDMHVSNLRKKLSESVWTVKSVHGVGYRFTQEAD